MAMNLKKALGFGNKKKADDFEDDAAAYSDPAVVHPTDPPSRNVRGISQPHYPPPRPQHSPNPRRKNQDLSTQGNKRPPANENKRHSLSGIGSGEPRRAPPRPNIAKKNQEDDYCDPIDVQRKDNVHPDVNNSAKDDYCEPWDTTTKADFGNKLPRNRGDDDEHNEYMDPYDTGKDGIMEKRLSRGLAKEFGLHARLTGDQQRKSAEVDSNVYDQVYESRKSQPQSNDYDLPWEFKQKAQMGKVSVPKPSQSQRAKPCPSDDYDEPWEKKQGYLLKNQVPAPGTNKTRSPAPLPRATAMATPDDQANGQIGLVNEETYEKPWQENPAVKNINGGQGARDHSPRRASQPCVPTVYAEKSRRTSQPVTSTSDSANYDTPWEYKKQFSAAIPPKPSRTHENDHMVEIDPNLPLDGQSWYHGPLKRLEAEALLREALDCSFLVRNSESSKKDFSLSMKNNENFMHLKIVRQLDGTFILGQFSKPFLDIPKVISHYSKNKLNIRGAEHKFLKHPIPVQPEYHTIEPDDSHL